MAEFCWIDAASVDEVPEGGVKGVVLGEKHIAIYRLQGAVHATSDVCTHDFALLSGGWVEDGIIECPLHGARFSVIDGTCHGPHGTDLRCYRTRVRDGRVEVDLANSDD